MKVGITGTGYAVVPVQTLFFAGVNYEIRDRPDVGRVTIMATPATRSQWEALRAQGGPYVFWASDRSNSWANSAYYQPLMQYFANTYRICWLIRGAPLIQPQWEFVYSCRPTYDASAITWNASGFSSAPSSY